MNNRWAAAAAAVLAATTLAGCFGSDPYCDAVEKHEETLNTFGAERTDAAYAEYAASAQEIAKAAPEDITADWETIAEVTNGVIAAQEAAGVPLDDMGDTDTVAQLSQEQRDALNASYQAFNDTVEQRKAVVADIDDRCGVTLEQPEAKE